MSPEIGSAPKSVFWIMAAFVILGIPLIAVLWGTFHELLAFEAPAAPLVAIASVVLLSVLLYFMKRVVDRRFAEPSRPTPFFRSRCLTIRPPARGPGRRCRCAAVLRRPA